MSSTFNWSSYSIFFTAENTQSFLEKRYRSQNIENLEQKSYENCYPFMYYLEHGKVYYEQARTSPLIIQPILIFYGLVHLIKACILTVEPNYPETTSVLAHGVSTRKRKKQQYLFFHDEVKIQKSGLFPFMAERLFSAGQLEGEKLLMSDLFMQIPELSDLFYQLDGKKTFSIVKNTNDIFYISNEILDSFHMTEERFARFFASKAAMQIELQEVKVPNLVFKIENMKAYNSMPLKYDLNKDSFSLSIMNNKAFNYHELLVHYLLLYNLSMIARYETEWWGELVKTMPNKDYPFIDTFLNLTLIKGPFLIYQYLVGQ